MTVYFIRAGDGPVKIGVADDVESRLRELQTGNHQPLHVIRSVPGARAEERWFHFKFQNQHIHREWFDYHPTMLTVEPPVIVPTVSTIPWDVIRELTGHKTSEEAFKRARSRGPVPSKWIIFAYYESKARGTPLTIEQLQGVEPLPANWRMVA